MNAYEEYSDKELDAQVAAITMDHLGMSNFEGNNDSKVYYTFLVKILICIVLRTKLRKVTFCFYTI